MAAATRPKRGRVPFSKIATVGIIYNALALCPTKKQFAASIEYATLRHAQGHPEHEDGDRQGMTDGEMVERVRAGHTAAFGELVERHRGAVYRAALAALRDTAEAEDVTQDALVLAFRKIGQFRGEASVRTWMVTIGWRLALSRRRNPMHRLRQMISSESPEAGTLSAPAPSIELRMVDRERLLRTRREIGKLSAKLRDALLLTAAGDLTQEEIAAALHIPAATFRWRVMEARRRLKEKLG